MAESGVWRQLLWTRAFGSYLGESGADDSFDAFMKLLRGRVARGGRLGRRKPAPSRRRLLAMPKSQRRRGVKR